jgi:uncharacterized cupredoxin-like copper-binding protein
MNDPQARLRRIALAAVLLLAPAGVAACGGDDSADTTATTMPDMGGGEFDFGAPGDAAAADRVIEVTAADDFSFTPNTVEVAAGETVTFRVTNRGAIVHEFVLGTEAVQDEHEEEMEEMGDMAMGDEPNAIDLEPGETKEFTWSFTASGSLLYGCHEPGHYDAGMHGDLTVSG